MLANQKRYRRRIMGILKKHIPKQREGRKMDARAAITFNSAAEAAMGYERIKEKLLQVYDWYQIAKLPMATFLLIDESGNEVTRKAKEGDYVRIDVPGPGTQTGGGYDWVKVEKIEESDEDDREMLSITLRPTSNPTNTDADIAHFFKEMATSTLLVSLSSKEVVAAYHGRNEVINTDTDKLLDKVRNFLVGTGAKIGFSFPQWKSLIEGLVATNEENGVPDN